MDGPIDLPTTEFERTLRGLEGLTREEIVALLMAHVDRDDDVAFAALTENLSLETLRLLSARALLAACSHRRPTWTWLAPAYRAGEPAVVENRPAK